MVPMICFRLEREPEDNPACARLHLHVPKFKVPPLRLGPWEFCSERAYEPIICPSPWQRRLGYRTVIDAEPEVFQIPQPPVRIVDCCIDPLHGGRSQIAVLDTIAFDGLDICGWVFRVDLPPSDYPVESLLDKCIYLFGANEASDEEMIVKISTLLLMRQIVGEFGEPLP